MEAYSIMLSFNVTPDLPPVYMPLKQSVTKRVNFELNSHHKLILAIFVLLLKSLLF